MPEKSRKANILEAYEKHLSMLKRVVARMVRNRHDVDDVVQEAFLRAYDAESNKPISHPKSYLFRTAENVALGLLRQQNRKPTDYLDDLESPDMWDGEWTLEEQLIAQEKLGLHCAAVAALPPKCRKVYLMRKVYGMRYQDIADAMNITVSTVETHMEKGYARCDAYIEERLRDRDTDLYKVKRGLEVRR